MHLHRAHEIAAGTELGWWDRLWPLVVTALLSLAVLWFLQFRAVPTVEARKRREDRWERDLLDLGQMLSFEVPASMTKIYAEVMWNSTTGQHLDADTRSQAFKRERERAQWAALREYRDLLERIAWLVDRVVSIDRESWQMKIFRMNEISLAVHGVDNLATAWREPGDAPATEDEIRAADEAGRDALKELIEAVKAMASGPPPRPSSRPGRLARRWRQKTAAYRRRVAAKVQRSRP